MSFDWLVSEENAERGLHDGATFDRCGVLFDVVGGPCHCFFAKPLQNSIAASDSVVQPPAGGTMALDRMNPLPDAQAEPQSCFVANQWHAMH
ncbi:MAG: hypothetical protein ACK58L_00620 [Planctomycetota bacterium]